MNDEAHVGGHLTEGQHAFQMFVLQVAGESGHGKVSNDCRFSFSEK